MTEVTADIESDVSQEQQQEAAKQEAIAVVLGDAVMELPQDLYVPPGALKVFLEAFEGPLDLLLYLIRKQNIDILDIPIAEVTRQYVQFVELMQTLELELAAEYLVMAALLAEIKSRMLLPKVETEDEEEEDPRAELVRRLQQYERFKQAADDLDNLERVDRDIFPAYAAAPPMEQKTVEAQVSMDEILKAFKEVMQRARMFASHQITRDVLSIADRMGTLLRSVDTGEFSRFQDYFTPEEGRMGVVVTLIAILELIKRQVIELTQSEAFGQIYVRRREDAPQTNSAEEEAEQEVEYDD